MADPEDKDATDAGGVFGNLPRSRPGTRSPRRAESANGQTAKAGAAKAKGASKAKAKTKAAPKAGAKRKAAPESQRPTPATPPPPKPPDEPPPEPPPPALGAAAHKGPERIGGIEDLAWAGVAVAAQAATAGVKAASRAMDAVRKSLDRQ